MIFFILVLCLLLGKLKNDHVLRGCIGTTSPISLLKGLQTYSIKSALHDGRFSPIKATELESLVCTLSLLTDYEECADYDDWQIGNHGISIRFEKNERSYHAIFLPEVMTEHGINSSYYVTHICRFRS